MKYSKDFSHTNLGLKSRRTVVTAYRITRHSSFALKGNSPIARNGTPKIFSMKDKKILHRNLFF